VELLGARSPGREVGGLGGWRWGMADVIGGVGYRWQWERCVRGCVG
jgi:hypothetical protein